MSLILQIQGNCDKDLSRYKHTLTNSGVVIGRGMKFDGSSYRGIDSVVSTLAATTVGSWFAWVKPTDATPLTIQVFLSFGDTSADEYMHIAIDANGTLRSILKKAGTKQWDFATDNAVFVDNTWKRIGIIQNGTEPVLYVNGVAPAQTFSVSTDKTKWISTCTNIDNGRIGCLNYNGGGNVVYFTGQIDDIRLHNTAKSAGFAALDYQKTKELPR